MDVVILLVFVSLVLVVAALVFFFSRLKAGDFDHGDRLTLLPLAPDENTNEATQPSNTSEPATVTIESPGPEPDVTHTAKEEGPPHGNHS